MRQCHYVMGRHLFEFVIAPYLAPAAALRHSVAQAQHVPGNGLPGRAMQRGLFAFTVEAADDGDDGSGWRLLPSLRYAHVRPHLLRLAQAHGFEPVLVEQAPVRHEQQRAVDGVYIVLRRLAVAADVQPGRG